MVASLFALAARCCLASVFLYSGYAKVLHPGGTLEAMTNAGVPAARILFPLAVLLEFGAGLLLILGAKARWAALFLVAFLVPVTYFFHFQEGGDDQIFQLLKNVAVTGGLLQVVAFGPGRYSLDGN